MHSINRDLELSRQKYFDLYNLVPIGYFTFDAYGLLLEVNRAGAQLIGTEPHLITGQPVVSFIIESAPGKGTKLIASIPLGLESPNE